jgi:hypothetical protein
MVVAVPSVPAPVAAPQNQPDRKIAAELGELDHLEIE